MTSGNVWLTKNVDSEEIRRYINLSDEIVCINSIGENILMRLSGADFDSDTALLTDNPILIGAAQRNYDKFLVPTSLVDAKRTVRHYTKSEQADLDIKTSVNKIGEIVNLSQELNTKLWDMLNNGATFDEVEELYCDIAKLDILSGIEIDKAKKEFTVDSVAEIKKLRQMYGERDDDGRQVKPNFFGKIARIKGYYDSDRKNYKFHKTTMDFLQHRLNKYRSGYTKRDILPFSSIIQPPEGYSTKSVKYSQIDRILTLVRTMRTQIKAVWSNTDDGMENGDKAALVASIRDECYGYIKSIHLNYHTSYRLLQELDAERNKDISRSLFYMLFSLPNQSFLDMIDSNRVPVPMLEEAECAAGDIDIYGFRFRKIIEPTQNPECSLVVFDENFLDGAD